MNIDPKHLQELVNDYASSLRGLHQGVSGSVDSPIEAQMLVAMLHCFRGEDFGMSSSRLVPDAIPAGHSIYIIRQAEIGPYRADFAVLSNYTVGKEDRFVIECDGHDFHERTKEQAERDRSRDRFMTAAGWRVFRFTGREINRSPLVCARQVLDAIWRASHD